MLPGHEGSSAHPPSCTFSIGLLTAATTQHDQDFYPVPSALGWHTRANAKHAPRRRARARERSEPAHTASATTVPRGGSSPGQNDSCPLSP